MLPRLQQTELGVRRRVQSEVADLVKAARQYVQKEAADELTGRHVRVPAVAGGDADGVGGDVEDPAVADRDPMRVPAQVSKDLPGSGLLGCDEVSHPKTRIRSPVAWRTPPTSSGTGAAQVRRIDEGRRASRRDRHSAHWSMWPPSAAVRHSCALSGFRHRDIAAAGTKGRWTGVGANLWESTCRNYAESRSTALPPEARGAAQRVRTMHVMSAACGPTSRSGHVLTSCLSDQAARRHGV